MTRAVLEGVAFGLKDSFTLIQNAGLGAISQVRASGGGTKGALWRQILASALEAELVTVKTTEGAAYGAALLAGVGVGAWPDVAAACLATVKLSDSTKPDSAQAETYRKSYALYRELYPALKASFGKMGAIA
jgi:xylulokinase